MLASLFACSKIKQWHNAAAEPDTESAITGDLEEADGENLGSDIGDLEGEEIAEGETLEEDQTLDETMNEAQQATEEYAGIESQPTEPTPNGRTRPPARGSQREKRCPTGRCNGNICGARKRYPDVDSF